MEERILALREQASIKTRDNRSPEIAIGDIVIVRNDQTKRVFWKLAKVEQLLRGEDGIPRAAVVRVLRENANHSQLLRRSIQHLIPIEVKHECERDDTKKSEQESVNAQILRPTERPQRNAAITGQLSRDVARTFKGGGALQILIIMIAHLSNFNFIATDHRYLIYTR